MRNIEPLDYDYVDYLIDSTLRFESFVDDSNFDEPVVIMAAYRADNERRSSGCARLIFDIEDDAEGWYDDKDGYVVLPPTVWWEIKEREEFDSYPYEFGPVLVADRTKHEFY